MPTLPIELCGVPVQTCPICGFLIPTMWAGGLIWRGRYVLVDEACAMEHYDEHNDQARGLNDWGYLDELWRNERG